MILGIYLKSLTNKIEAFIDSNFIEYQKTYYYDISELDELINNSDVLLIIGKNKSIISHCVSSGKTIYVYDEKKNIKCQISQPSIFD